MDYKTAILPIIAVIALLITAMTGQEIDKATQENLAAGLSLVITSCIAIWGVIKNHKKKGDNQK